MKSVIMQLYNGELFPYENLAPTSKEFEGINQRITKELNNWKEQLSKEEYEKLELIYDLESQAGSIEIEKAFVSGFRLASLFMMEVFMGAGEES